jgi:hypothetical protein
MQIQTQIQVRVNEEGALRNQRYAFTDRLTLVTELLQNARRAGATRIDVDYDAMTQRLRITDNGRGIEDFQKLLVFNESGWDDATQQHEHPFGIGFSKCLYSATRCIIRSGDRFIDFLSADALVKQMINVYLDTTAHIKGTQIELFEVDLPELSDRIGPLCAGFPVEVIYNGKPLDRPYAQDRLKSIRSTIGEVHLVGTLSGNHADEMLVFLQGFRVYYPCFYSPARVNVVHLDPERFMARLPDRDKLIDESDQIKLIDAEIKQQWRSILEVAKQQLSPRQFVDRYHSAMRSFDHLDLLNDLDVLPRGVCSAICDYPVMGNDVPDDFLDSHIDPPDRESIDNGSIVVVELDGVHEENTAHWMFARAKGFVVGDSYMLHENHWLHDKIRKLSEEMIGLEPVGTPLHAHFSGTWVAANLVLCHAVCLRVGDDMVDIDKDAVYHGGVIFVPAGETSGDVVGQISSYVDAYDCFRKYEKNTDVDDLSDLIRRLRSVDPQETLMSLLQPLKLEKYPILHGKTFRVCVDWQAATHSIELIE